MMSLISWKTFRVRLQYAKRPKGFKQLYTDGSAAAPRTHWRNRISTRLWCTKICQFAKILSVADVYDALVTKRPYKDALSQRDAVEMLMSMTNQLDIGVMRAFMSSMILYPVDSIVQLSNGEKARVVKTASTTFSDQLLSVSIPAEYTIWAMIWSAQVLLYFRHNDLSHLKNKKADASCLHAGISFLF